MVTYEKSIRKMENKKNSSPKIWEYIIFVEKKEKISIKKYMTTEVMCTVGIFKFLSDEYLVFENSNNKRPLHLFANIRKRINVLY